MEKDVKSQPVPCYMCGQRIAVYDSKDGVPVCDRCAPELQPEVKNEEVSDKTPVTEPKTYRGSDVKISVGDKEIKGFEGIDWAKEFNPCTVKWDGEINYDDVRDAIQYSLNAINPYNVIIENL